MSHRGVVAAALAGYNLIQNRALPASLYVPANLAVSAGLVALARRAGCTWDELGLGPRHARSGLVVGAITGAAIGSGAALAASRPGARDHFRDERAADQDVPAILFRTVVRFPLGTALFEEIAFRGVVEATWVREGASEREAATAAAVLFGLWHLIPTRDALGGNPLSERIGSDSARAGTVIAGAVVTGLASIGFSWLRRRSGSVVAPWMAHTAISVAGYLAGVSAWRHSADG